MLELSNKIIDLIKCPQHVYNGDVYNLIGHAGDLSIGEYVYLYLKTNTDSTDPSNSKIIEARFSAIGGATLIALAEQFCSLITNITFNEALQKCDDENGFANGLNISIDHIHSFNFIVQAFYISIETLIQSSVLNNLNS